MAQACPYPLPPLHERLYKRSMLDLEFSYFFIKMAIIGEKDLNSNELITALRGIEMESVNMVEVHFLREENQLLRNELHNRHQSRLGEIQQLEKKKLALIRLQNQAYQESLRFSHLQTSVVRVNRTLDDAMNLLFQVSCGFLSYGNTPDIFDKLKNLHKLIHEASKYLSQPFEKESFGSTYIPFSDESSFLPYANPVQEILGSQVNVDSTARGETMVPSSASSTSPQVQNQELDAILEEIKNYSFVSNPVSEL